LLRCAYAARRHPVLLVLASASSPLTACRGLVPCCSLGAARRSFFRRAAPSAPPIAAPPYAARRGHLLPAPPVAGICCQRRSSRHSVAASACQHPSSAAAVADRLQLVHCHLQKNRGSCNLLLYRGISSVGGYSAAVVLLLLLCCGSLWTSSVGRGLHLQHQLLIVLLLFYQGCGN
jgi:hypothetical protein